MKAEMFLENVIRSRAEGDVDIEGDRSRTEPQIFGDPPGTARRPPIEYGSSSHSADQRFWACNEQFTKHAVTAHRSVGCSISARGSQLVR